MSLKGCVGMFSPISLNIWILLPLVNVLIPGSVILKTVKPRPSKYKTVSLDTPLIHWRPV